MERLPIERLVERMFWARRIVLQALGVLAVLVSTGSIVQYVCLLAARFQLMIVAAPMAVASFILFLGVPFALLAILVGALVVCYYVFRVGMRGVGLGYAISHTLLCVVFTCVLLLGVILVPLVVRSDLARRGVICTCEGEHERPTPDDH